MSAITPLTPLRRLFRLLHLERRDIEYIYIYAIVAGMINLTLPLGVQAILNFLQAGVVSASWWLLIVAVTIGTLMAGILVIMQLSVSETLQRRIFTRISFDFAQRLPRLQTEAVRKKHLPELVNRFFDTLTLQKSLPKMLIDVSTALMQIFFGLLLLSFYHPFFILFGLILLLILFLIFRITAPVGLKSSLKESKYKYEVAYWLEEVARTMQTFKLAGQSELHMRRTDELVSNYLDAKKSHFKVLSVQYFSIIGFKTLTTFTLLSLGGWLVWENQLNIGQFVAAEIIIIMTLGATEKLIASMDPVYDVLTSLEKLGAIADLPIEPDGGLELPLNKYEKGLSVSLRDISFRHSDSTQPVLSNINLDIRPGEKVCIAGYNGAGKTTLVQLVSCLLEPKSGAILYNEIPRTNLNLPSLRAAIGDYSAQEDIFEGSLLENISLGHEHVSLETIIQICAALGLEDFIAALPDGYATPLAPGGKNLPRSVAAKIILARSIVARPKLLAIEELMANFEQTDRVRMASLLTAADSPWTLIAVTDDPELASRCDRVIVLNHGEVVAEGAYADIRRTEHGERVFKY